MESVAAAFVEVGGARDRGLDFLVRQVTRRKLARIDRRDEKQPVLRVRYRIARDLVLRMAERTLLVEKYGVIERPVIAQLVEHQARDRPLPAAAAIAARDCWSVSGGWAPSVV